MTCLASAFNACSQRAAQQLLYKENAEKSLAAKTLVPTEQCIEGILIDRHLQRSPRQAYAVDGTLSLSVRPSGWTKTALGPSIKRLGAGTGGSVDLHYCRSLNKVVAVKTLREADGKSAGSPVPMRQQVLEELGIASNVRHPNIVRTFEIIVEANICYLVMEACTTNLLTLLQQKRQTGRPADLGVFVQLVRGVHYLHSMGIGHRDLKLDNVCITEQGTVKIVDFGCATLFRRRQAQSTDKSVDYVETLSVGVCGSDPYMAPELFSASSYFAPKVDIWALGIIYFALRHLQFPWAVAHEAHDSGFCAFARSPRPFIDTWFGGDIQAVNFLNMTQRQCQMTHTAQHIMARVLDVNPSTRADIYDIIRDPWFQSL
ncbi:serine/threonine protein kinase [Coemansia sp. RSA 1290]|nr:serine/threonine protein kinase [Coemansia sp. RSA 1290]